MSQSEKIELLQKKFQNITQQFEENFRDRINELLLICKESQGEYRDSSHGPGSWATTYSNEFIDSASEIYFILDKNPLLNAKTELSKLFIKNGIRSCRNKTFGIEKVEYFHKNHLRLSLKVFK